MKRTLRLGVILSLAVFAQTAFAQDFDNAAAPSAEGDSSSALNEWLVLAKQGDADAQSMLGMMYSEGVGVAENDAEALRWYHLAAEQGHANAQLVLGNMYDKGKGVPEDDTEAVRWYRRAAEQGHANAQVMLGVMYSNGTGVLRNDVLAFMWSNIAAASGNSAALPIKAISATKLIPQQRAEAETMSSICMQSNYKDCGY
ncbi:MAG: hypothetical protein RIT52_382 [Pseudomonadota bacterium]|jgi:uncharacterized protein